MTYAERRAAGFFEEVATEEGRQATLAAPEPVAPDNRAHVPLGADKELYDWIASQASSLAGFLRFDLAYDTPGAQGAPGIELVQLKRADVVLDSWLFVLDPFDGNQPIGYLTLDGMPDPAQTFTVDAVTNWQGYGFASEGEGLFGVVMPVVFWKPTLVHFYVGDNQGGDPGSAQGSLVLILRVLPSSAAYPVT